MENILFNDLIRRGMDVDVGIVEYNTKNSEGKNIRKQLEVDFVVNKGNDRYYIQSAFNISDPEKREQETASLIRIPDSFKKVVVAKIGAVMPSGLLIKEGNLRGVDSFGMLCSARELAIPGAPEVKGILVLDETAEVGSAFVSPTR